MLWSIDTCQNKISADPYHMTISGLKFLAHWGYVFFLSWLLTKSWLSIGSWAHVWLTCWKQGRIVQRAVNANPGLKVNWIITFFYANVFCCFVLCIQCLLKLKTEGQTICRKPRLQVTKFNQNSTFSCVSLIGLWKPSPGPMLFRLA